MIEILGTTFQQPPLRITATNARVSYRIFEVSSCMLGILSSEQLTTRDYLCLEAAGRRIPLRVFALLPPLDSSPVPPQKGYRLLCLDPLMELDRLLLGLGRDGLEGLQALRCSVQPQIYVELALAERGCLLVLESVNISRTGLLLRHSRSSEIGLLTPKENLLLRLDIAKMLLPEALLLQGRIVRSYCEPGKTSQICFVAVQLTDSSRQKAEIWQNLVRRMERGMLSGLACVA